MPLMTCNECGVSASTSAMTCPGCGASAKVMRKRQSRWPTSRRGWVLLGLLGLFLLSALIQLVGGAPTPQPKSPADMAADQRNRVAYNAIITIKKSLREPGSAKFASVLVNDAATTVCMTYHARNGLGGMGTGHMVFLHGVPSEKKSDWNRHCANKAMYELKGIARVAG